MTSLRRLVLRRIVAGTLALAATTAGGVMLSVRTVTVAHESPAIIIREFDKVGVQTVGTTRSVPVMLEEAAAHDLLIGAEFEGGANDPDTFSNNDPISYGAPDAFCHIPAGEWDCILELALFLPTSGDTIRVWVASGDAFIDTHEAIAVSGGCIAERDGTEALRMTVLGFGGSEPPPPVATPADADPDPRTCDTGTATATPSDPPTETPDPTSTPTSSASPTPTTAPSVFVAPFDGRYRARQCTTYLPQTSRAPCDASGEAFTETGLAQAVAAVGPVEDDPATMAQADASAGVIQPASLASPSVVVVRFRVHRAAIEAQPASPTLGSPVGGVEMWVSTDSQCGTASNMMALPIDGSGEIENQVVEVSLEVPGCDTITSIRAGVRTNASTMPGASGRVRSEAIASIERITA